MVKKKNLFSQITDRSFYEGEPIRTWYVTDNVAMSNTSQSYTTTVEYDGEIDTTSTRYGSQGIEYYEYVTTVSGTVTATVHPYEYVNTTSEKSVELVKNTSVSDTYRVAVENSLSFSYSESDSFYYEAGRVENTGYMDVTLASNIEKPSNVTASMWEIVSVYNNYGDGNNNVYKSARIDASNLVSGTIRLDSLYLVGGGILPAASMYESHTFYAAFTYKTFETLVSKTTFTHSRYISIGKPSGTPYTNHWTGSYAKNYPYLTYYSKETSWYTLTTVTKTYTVPAKTTSSWVVPKQVSDKV